LWARRNSLALTVRSGIAQFACIGKECYGLPTLDCNLYSQAFSPNDPNPEHPIPSSITCAARSFEKSRDPAPSTEQDCNRIASVGRLFGNRRRTEWRSVGAAACSDDDGHLWPSRTCPTCRQMDSEMATRSTMASGHILRGFHDSLGQSPRQTGLNPMITDKFSCVNYVEKINRFRARILRSSRHFGPAVHVTTAPPLLIRTAQLC